jgi:aldehyde:ferredoxin oxidoreductase
MLKEIPQGIDAFDEKNKIIIATSVLTGSIMPGSSRFSIGALSPLSGGYGESEAGGWWGPELKFAGYNMVIIEGKAKEPVYISIDDNVVEIRDAKHIWGKETHEAEKIIKDEGNKRTRVLQIGIAGENLVRYAAITNELRHWCGRAGLGSVFGSKNLRAIAVSGTGGISQVFPEKVKELARWFAKNMHENEGLAFKSKYGTAGGVEAVDESGMFPTRNFQKGHFDGYKKLSGIVMYDTLIDKREGCYACPVRCKRVVKYNSEEFNIDPIYGGPEYESIGSLGSNCEIDDLATVCKANELCGRYGIDTISTGVTIAFAMECNEKGLLPPDLCEGLDVSFGNKKTFLNLIKMIAKRDSKLGDLLAEGSYRAGEFIGNGAVALSMTSKKQEFPAHEPRGKWGVGLGYAMSPTGGDHLVAAHDIWFEHEPDYEHELTYMDIEPMKVFGINKPLESMSLGSEKVRLFAHLQYLWSLYNVLDLCIFVGVPEYRMLSINQILEMVNAITGWKVSFWELIKVGEIGIQLSRLFNILNGFTDKDDSLPQRMFEPLLNGALEGRSIDKETFEKAKKIYYEIMGWNGKGIPTYGKFVELGIEELYSSNLKDCAT